MISTSCAEQEKSQAVDITQTDFYKASPDWLKLALIHPDWVAQQSEAWNRWNTPGNWSPSPQFFELKIENPQQSVDQLARHFQQLAERHQAAYQELASVSSAFQGWFRNRGNQ